MTPAPSRTQQRGGDRGQSGCQRVKRLTAPNGEGSKFTLAVKPGKRASASIA
jgi:hypothetical protein